LHNYQIIIKSRVIGRVKFSNSRFITKDFVKEVEVILEAAANTDPEDPGPLSLVFP